MYYCTVLYYTVLYYTILYYTELYCTVLAITCYLQVSTVLYWRLPAACRHQNESKSRKYLTKVLWLLTYDNEQLELAEAVDKYSPGQQVR